MVMEILVMWLVVLFVRNSMSGVIWLILVIVLRGMCDF